MLTLAFDYRIAAGRDLRQGFREGGTHMRKTGASKLPDILRKHERELLAEWIEQQLNAASVQSALLSERELHQQSRQFLTALSTALQRGDTEDITTPAWAEVRELLEGISQQRAT